MSIDYTQARFWWDFAQAVATLALTCAVYFRKPGLKAIEEVDELRAQAAADVAEVRIKLDDHISSVGRELATLHERIAHMPTKEQLAHVLGTLRGIEAQAQANNEALATLRAQTTRIESFLLNRSAS